MAQLDRIKRETIDRLKAEGVEYEQRIEALDQLEWPKPNREFIYATFNDFSDRHPWVGSENIAPKSIAREILERFCSFNDYIRDYGLQRSEGILLRYLSEVTKALAQGVPARFRTPAVEELGFALASVVRGVDASLLEEWRSLRDPAASNVAPALEIEETPAGKRPPDLLTDVRALTARVRADLHRLLGALARKDYEEASLSVRVLGDEDDSPPERLAAAMSAFYPEHSRILVTPTARHTSNTVVRAREPLVWEAEQRILDPEGHDDWAIHAEVDLTAGVPEDGPLIRLVRLGV
jgi:hypothetical protein